MKKIVIAAPALEPNPMVVMQLLRAVGGKVRTIADQLSRKAPLIDEDFPDRPGPEQVTRIRALIKVLDQAATRPRIQFDGREIQPGELNDIIEAAEKLQMRPTASFGELGS